MGKKSKLRPCPGIGGTITAADCGENRQSKIRCPALCSYNPFSELNYDEFLAIEENTLHWIAHRGGPESLGVIGEAELMKLRNDERIVVQAVMQRRTGLLEIRQVFDDQALEVVDLLQPGAPPMRIVDRTCASTAVRFATLLTPYYRLPHYYRLSGPGISLPSWPRFTAEEVVRATVEHLGGPSVPAEQAEWLGTGDHLDRLNQSIHATAAARRADSIGGLKAKWLTKDIARQLKASIPPFDPKLVPPSLRREVDTFEITETSLEADPDAPAIDPKTQVLAELTRRWVGESIPALEGLSPRQAATVPHLRPVLIHLVKGEIRLQDESNLWNGTSVDINWLPRELGLAELDVPAPPLRDIPDDALDDDDEDEHGEYDDFDVPPLEIPSGVISAADAAELLHAATEPFELAQDAIDWLTEDAGLDPVALADNTVAALLSDEEFSILIAMMLPVCVAYARAIPDELDDASMIIADHIRGELEWLENHPLPSSRAEFAALTKQCEQPAILAEVLRLSATARKSFKPKPSSPSATAAQFTFLRALIDGLDWTFQKK